MALLLCKLEMATVLQALGLKFLHGTGRERDEAAIGHKHLLLRILFFFFYNISLSHSLYSKTVQVEN